MKITTEAHIITGIIMFFTALVVCGVLIQLNFVRSIVISALSVIALVFVEKWIWSRA